MDKPVSPGPDPAKAEQAEPEPTPMISSLAGSSSESCDRDVLGPPRQPGHLGSLGRFDIHQRIGVGGMGVVYQARYAGPAPTSATDAGEPAKPQWVVVKVLRPDVGDRRACQYFENEARHQMRLDHPNILKVSGVGEHNRRPFYVMPWVSGGSLADLLSKRVHLSERRIIEIALQIAQGLAHAHKQGIIHRDLKPSNILFDAGGRVLLADFGLSRHLFNDPVLRLHTDHCLGTAPYMSPAVAAGEAEDTRCDIYSFGALLYEMLAGHAPYTGSTQEEILQKIIAGPPPPLHEQAPRAPIGLIRIVEWAMARVLRERYAGMPDVMADLARVQSEKPPLGPHASTVARSMLKQPRLAQGAVALILLALLLGALYVLGTGPLRLLRTLEVPGIRSWVNACRGEWNGDGELDFFVVRGNQVEVVSLNGEVIDQGLIAPKEAEDVWLDWVRDVDGDGRDELFVSWREGSHAVISVKNQHFLELKRFEMPGTASP
jgi:serine/threonine protein kinase